MNEKNIINLGMPGDNTVSALNRFEQNVAKHSPGMVILWYGANDALNSSLHITPETFYENLKELVLRCYGIGASPVLCTVHQAVESDIKKEMSKNFRLLIEAASGPNAMLNEYNKKIRLIAKDYNALLFDWSAYFQGSAPSNASRSAYLLSVANNGNGILMKPRGYNYFAWGLSGLICPHITKHTKIVCLGDEITYGSGIKGAGTTDGYTYPARLGLHLEFLSASMISSQQQVITDDEQNNNVIVDEKDTTTMLYNEEKGTLEIGESETNSSETTQSSLFSPIEGLPFDDIDDTSSWLLDD